MTTLYLRTGGGNWGTATTWSLSSGGGADGSVPTAADDLICDVASLTANLTVNGTSGAPNLCRSLTCTGFVGTLTMGSGAQFNMGDGTIGHLVLVAGMTFSPNVAANMKFVSTTGPNNLTWGGKNLPGGLLTFDGVGGSWQFQDAPAQGLTPTVGLTNGALDLNSKAMIGAFSSSNSNTRSLTTGTMNWTMSSATFWETTNTTGLTLNATGVTFLGTNLTSAAMAGNFGGVTVGNISCTALTSGTLTINGSPTFTGDVTLSTNGSPAGTITAGYALGGNLTVQGTYRTSGNSAINRAFVRSTTAGVQRTITAATVSASMSNVDIRDIIGAGAGSWNLASIAGGSGDCGNNSGITFNTPKNCYMKTAVSVNWSANNWYTTSGGSTPISPVSPPLPQDTAIFDANSVTAGSRTISLDSPCVRLPAINCTGVLNSPALDRLTIHQIYGSLTLVAGMTFINNSQSINLCGQGTHTYDAGGLSQFGVVVDCGIGNYTFARNIVFTGGCQVATGTLNQGGFTASYSSSCTLTGGVYQGSGAVTGTALTVSGGTASLTSLITLTGAVSCSSGILNVAAAGITGNTTTTISATGVLNLAGQINGSGALSVTGGTINDTGAAGELKGTTASFSGGTSSIRKMTLSSTFAISSTANLTLNPGTFTYVTSWTETGTTKVFAVNGTLSEAAGVKTVTAAAAVGTASFAHP